MRRAAIERSLTQAGVGDVQARAWSEEAFEVWLAARNKHAEHLLFSGAALALERTAVAFPGVKIGAITNGRGDISAIPTLAPYFSYSVSGEEEGVFPHRKPSLDIYKEAVRRATGGKGFGDEVWVHCGDDLENDVAPAREMGMLTVYLCHHGDRGRGGFSTMSPEEEAARQAKAEAMRDLPDVTISSIDQLPDALAALMASRTRASSVAAA